MPASASDSWDRRISDIWSLGHQNFLKSDFILQLLFPLLVLLRSQQFLKPLGKKRKDLSCKKHLETFSCSFHKMYCSVTHLLLLLLLSLTAG